LTSGTSSASEKTKRSTPRSMLNNVCILALSNCAISNGAEGSSQS
jgi:hypothetical protein